MLSLRCVILTVKGDNTKILEFSVVACSTFKMYPQDISFMENDFLAVILVLCLKKASQYIIFHIR
jgi:hypothetical protein